MHNIETDLENFLKTMQFKIDKNKHKECAMMNNGEGGRKWDHCTIEWLISRAEEELIELKEALKEGDLPSAVLECADVGNFMAFAHANLVRKIDLEE